MILWFTGGFDDNFVLVTLGQVFRDKLFERYLKLVADLNVIWACTFESLIAVSVVMGRPTFSSKNVR